MRLLLPALVLIALASGVSSAQVRVGKDVLLRWDVSPESDASTYQIYESFTSGGQDLNGTPLSIVVHPLVEWPIKENVADGVHWFVVTATDDVGNESGPSNEVGIEMDSDDPANVLNLRIILPDGTIVGVNMLPDGTLVDVLIVPVEEQK